MSCRSYAPTASLEDTPFVGTEAEGILHCAGYEDKSDEGFRAIHAEEDRILAAIGVGPVFGGRQS